MPGENVGATGNRGQDTGMKSSEIAYLAGLFDGEGCVTYKQRLEHRKGKPKAYLYWQIRLEILQV